MKHTSRIKFISFLALSLSVVARAEDATVSAASPTPAPSESKVVLGVELRPSFGTRVGEAHTEDFVIGGYQWSKNGVVYYKQEFNTNLEDPTGRNPGLGLYAYDGSLRVKLSNLWRSGALSLSTEPRVYVPTHAPKREAGQIVTLRNHLKLKWQNTERVALVFEEVPMAHIYNQPGITRSAASREANPVAENRISVGPEVMFTPSLRLNFPITLNSVRYADYQPGAKQNDRWGHKLWMWPELMYAYNPNISFGLAYYSDNFIAPDFSRFTIGDGFSKGVSQVIVAASL